MIYSGGLKLLLKLSLLFNVVDMQLHVFHRGQAIFQLARCGPFFIIIKLYLHDLITGIAKRRLYI